MYFDQYLTALAKTEPPLSLIEHSSDVLQVALYLITQNADRVKRPDIVKAGALTHDVGKLKNDRQRGQWIHTPHSSVYLEPLLDDPRFQALMAEAGIDSSSLDRELLLAICQEHHNPSPKLIRRCSEAILVSVADVLASSICSGIVGSITEILRSNPYMQINLELVKSLGFDKGLDGELHHIDLPNQVTEDLFLANMIFRVLDKPLRDGGITPLLQKGASLWVIGTPDTIQTALKDFAVDPKKLYESAFTDSIYDSIMTQFPPGAMQIDILRYLLVNESSARKMAIALYTRDKPRKLLERHNLSHLADKASELFANSLQDGIDSLWSLVRSKILELAPAMDLPLALAADVEIAATGEKRSGLALFAESKSGQGMSKKNRKPSARAKHNGEVLKSVQEQDKELANDVKEFLKLFDCSLNSYRSLTNILLEFVKMQADIQTETFSLPLIQVVFLDGLSLLAAAPIDNANLCPICRRFAQGIKAPALITGRSEGDSRYYENRRTREGAIKICSWCFLAGYIDLPIANIIREGNSVIKEREYLIVTSPLPKEKLQNLVDFMRQGRQQSSVVSQGGDASQQPQVDAAEVSKLEAMLGMASGYDELAVLGLSQRRLSHIKGFVLPTANALANWVGVGIPFEQLVGEYKVSGAVRRELVKATMYDMYLATEAPSMHYNIVTDTPFSVDGQPIMLEDMERANIAYRLADKDNFCRRFNKTKRIWQLDSGLYALLLSDSWTAINQALLKLHRDKRSPNEQKIQEVIAMAEKIAQGDQWKFVLGQRITGVLVEIDLLPKARSFWKNQQQLFTGVDLTKWLQRLKMAHDETGMRQWGNQLINALKAGRVASREFKEQRGIEIRPPGEETIGKILALVDEVIDECSKRNCKISEFARDVSEMDYILLFNYNQKAKENK